MNLKLIVKFPVDLATIDFTASCQVLTFEPKTVYSFNSFLKSW